MVAEWVDLDFVDCATGSFGLLHLLFEKSDLFFFKDDDFTVFHSFWT